MNTLSRSSLATVLLLAGIFSIMLMAKSPVVHAYQDAGKPLPPAFADRCLEVAEQLGYADRLKLVLNRADSAFGIRVADVENSVGRKIDHQVVSDGRTVVYALNRGVPFVWSNSQAPVSEDILKISRALVEEEGSAATDEEKEPAKKSLFGRR